LMGPAKKLGPDHSQNLIISSPGVVLLKNFFHNCFNNSAADRRIVAGELLFVETDGAVGRSF